MTRNPKFGGSILRVFAIQICAILAVVGLAALSFLVSPHIKIRGEPIIPLIPPLIVAIFGFPFALYILPKFIRLNCPKCRKKALRYDCFLSLSFRCTRCGVEKHTWISIGGS